MDEPNRVRVLTRDQIVWMWDREPYVLLQEDPDSEFLFRVDVDPFPAYAHDPVLAGATLARLMETFPLLFPPEVVLLEFEATARINAWVQHVDKATDETFNEEANYPYDSLIVLSGKRGPLHPAMTRFLVAHEYGHLIEHQLVYQAGKQEQDLTIINAYAARRGLAQQATRRLRAGQRWHDRPSEVFADDFRILVAGVELEHWPHPGIPRPETVEGLAEWWMDLQREALTGATNGRAN